MNQKISILQNRLDDLIRIAKSNERKDMLFRNKELKLIKLESLFSLIAEATIQHEKEFSLSHAILCLELESESLITNIFNIENKSKHAFINHLNFVKRNSVRTLFEQTKKPNLGIYNPIEHQHFFGIRPKCPSSVCILPLERRGKIFGVLALGSDSESRFKNTIGTALLEHYAAVLEVCLDNAFLISKVRDSSYRDPLTKLWNRRFFDDAAQKEIDSASATEKFSIFLVDIDKFKLINDNFGHDVGDEVIKELAKLLSNEFASIGNVCRWGGEEFLCWICHSSSMDLHRKVDDFRKMVESHCFNNNENALEVTVSIGLVTVDKSITAEDKYVLSKAIKVADENLYAAKTSGRNKVVFKNNIF